MCNEVKQHCSDKQYRCTAPLRKQDIQFDDQQNKTKSSFRIANHKQVHIRVNTGKGKYSAQLKAVDILT